MVNMDNKSKGPGEWTIEELLREHPRHVDTFSYWTGLPINKVKADLEALRKKGKARKCGYLVGDWWIL